MRISFQRRIAIVRSNGTRTPDAFGVILSLRHGHIALTWRGVTYSGGKPFRKWKHWRQTWA